MTPASAKAKYPLNKYKQAVDLMDYFEQRVVVPEDAWSMCWKFKTVGDKDGYPQVTGSKHAQIAKLTRAHQVSYYLHKGTIPEDKIVCHTCDNPWCVNPNHLFLGSWNDNVQDMLKKSRYRHPTSYGKGHKLTKQQRDEINALKGIKSSLVVAKEYGVSFSTVCSMWRKL